MSKNTYKVDIKNVMNALDTRDHSWYDKLTEEEKKDISIWQIMRFMSSCQSKSDDIEYHYLIMTNEIVNTHFNLLRNDPELQFKLLQIVGLGLKQYHPWIPPAKRQKTNKLFDFFLERYPTYREDDVYDLLSISTKEEIIKFLQDNGLSDEEIKELTK